MNLWIPLISRHVVRLVGENALHFLQGLSTNDMGLVKEGEAVFTAFLNRQGRFLADAFVFQYQDQIYLEYDAAHESTLAHLCRTYGPLNGVTTQRMPWVVISFMGPQVHTLMPQISERLKTPRIWYPDPRHVDLGVRVVMSYQYWHTLVHELCIPGTEPDYYCGCIRLGIPSGAYDLIPQRSFILDYDYHLNHGVSWNKGCYVGQEVMARSFYQDRIRRTLFCASHIQSCVDAPKAGDKIFDTEYVHKGYWGHTVQGNCLLSLDKAWAFEHLASASSIHFLSESKAPITAVLHNLHTPQIPQYSAK